MLRYPDGTAINVEGKIEETENEILVTGNAKWKQDEKTDEHYLLLDGKVIKSNGKQLASTGCASHLCVVDWEGDQDYDLLVGTIGGELYLIMNQGSAHSPSWGKAQALDFKAQGRDAGPTMVDWDDDGDLDLVVGLDSGGVSYYQNSGTRSEPQFGKPVQWIADSELKEKDTLRKPGTRTKVCVTDWNGDGKLDLLMGDYARIFAPESPPSKALLKERKEAQEQLNKLNQEFFQLIDSLKPLKDKRKRKKINEKITLLQKEMGLLQEKIPRAQPHGNIWFYAGKETQHQKIPPKSQLTFSKRTPQYTDSHNPLQKSHLIAFKKSAQVLTVALHLKNF